MSGGTTSDTTRRQQPSPAFHPRHISNDSPLQRIFCAPLSGFRRAIPLRHPLAVHPARQPGQSKITQNRNRACPSSRHRPPGKQCDEYPFASTWQGASSGGGQFSWRMINATQNEDGGRALKNFYGYNRIIEKDKFLVWIK
ncbi:hypothetical protein GCM10010317_101950 [Streptomyces mirabilis]|uniref:NucA/NucB deoxyribonuclease domain-containing protein n=1 Tax=Streptomyces mirabilis TaxID=68239 RepID=UPI00167DF91F|nr:NucA/NucB deoxyribonuclease domain-containing protein [Streptomyces mirabilis]GHD80231.1 hypothetical protein GCM10010317_101950 [Streptomyces mirabilis]